MHVICGSHSRVGRKQPDSRVCESVLHPLVPVACGVGCRTSTFNNVRGRVPNFDRHVQQKAGSSVKIVSSRSAVWLQPSFSGGAIDECELGGVRDIGRGVRDSPEGVHRDDMLPIQLFGCGIDACGLANVRVGIDRAATVACASYL